MDEDIVDHVARQMSQQALDRIEGHEKLCTERWGNVRGTLKGINAKIWWMITGIVGGQSAILLVLWNSLNAGS